MQQDAPLSNIFKGLRRDLAPHLLDADSSPDTQDAAQYQNKAGVLGPRMGRTRQYNSGYNILGCGSFNFPNVGRGRIIVDGNGEWNTTTQAWPDTSAPTQLNWDRLTWGTLSVTQTGVGTTNGTAKTFSAIDLAQFGAKILYVTAAGFSVTFDGVTAGRVQMDIRVGGVWARFADMWNYDSTPPQIVESEIFVGIPSTGSFDAVRMTAVLTSGGGSPEITSDFVGAIYLIRGAEGNHITAT